MLHAVRAMPSRATAALACLVLVASAAVSVVLGRGLSTWQQAVGGSAHQVVAGLRSTAGGSSITVPTAPAQPPAPTATTGHSQHVTPTVSATHTQRVATGTASAAAHHSGPRSTASHQQQRSGGRHDGNLVKQVQNTAARSTGLRSVDVG